MNIRSVLSKAYREVRRPVKFMYLLVLGILLSASYPSDLASYPVLPASGGVAMLVDYSEHYLRFVPTIVQVALPVLLRDKVGAVQLLYVAISTTAATHITKRLLNDRYVLDTRLGQRPSRTGSKHNMPSGHSSMASCAVYFVGRRYHAKLGMVLVFFLVLAMYARVILNDHTISAVLAGSLIGFLCAACFTSAYLQGEPGERQTTAFGALTATFNRVSRNLQIQCLHVLKVVVECRIRHFK